MKRAMLALLLVTTTTMADEKCDVIESGARFVMEMRQSGTSMRKFVDAVQARSDEEPDNKEAEVLGKLYKSFAELAWSKPLYSTEQMKQRAINEFADEFYLTCRKGK